MENQKNTQGDCPMKNSKKISSATIEFLVTRALAGDVVATEILIEVATLHNPARVREVLDRREQSKPVERREKSND